MGLAARRISDQISLQGGLTVWLALRWYPVQLLFYSGGIAAVAAGRYDNLRDLMLVPIRYPFDPVNVEPTLMHSVAQAMLELDRTDAFKLLPGFERRFTPRSDYLHVLFAPILEEVLFLGSDYDNAFDRFEVLYALEHCHRYDTGSGTHRWGPVGRFAWKRRDGGTALDQVILEAESERQDWPPIRAKLFGGSIDRFVQVAKDYRAEIQGLRWR